MNDSGITFVHKILTAEGGKEVLLEALLLSAGISLQMPCGGNHRCGKCKLRVSGDLLPPSTEERALLTDSELLFGIRLACFAVVNGTVTVEVPETELSTLSAVSLPACHLTRSGYGLAVDIGTTTVAVQLYDLSTGTICGESLSGNRQSIFGADVISRIEFSNQNSSQLLSNSIHIQLEQMATDCMRQSGISSVQRAVITGNTTMLHFWEGLDPRSIAVTPFTPVSLFGSQSGQTLAGVSPYLPPCVGAYVGGDVTCAILSSGMHRTPEKTSLLIDLGTNGEIVLLHQGKLFCTSTAMGPAFEGASLSCGMTASAGAVFSVRTDNAGHVQTSVVSNCVPRGICGSGILDAVSTMLELGYLDETGLLLESGSGIQKQNGQSVWKIPGTDILITQQDIRQVQLAKAAVHAGIQTLLNAANLTCEDVDIFYIGGGFGHYMNLDSAVRIGLIPAPLKKHARILGNAALAGAAYLLLEADAVEELQIIFSKATEYSLSGNPQFSENYVESMMF